MMRRSTIIAAILVAALASLAAAGVAISAPAPHVKVDVCHATGSQSNPYVLINVNVNSVGVANDLNGHAGHAGDIWAPFTYNGVVYAGQGDQSILANGCKTENPPNGDDVPPTLKPATSIIPATCDQPDTTVILDNSASVDGVDNDGDDDASATVSFTIVIDNQPFGAPIDVPAGEVQNVDVGKLAFGTIVQVFAGGSELASYQVDKLNCNSGGDDGNPPKHDKKHPKTPPPVTLTPEQIATLDDPGGG